tara:strand:- start:776 stop:1240 length:465 start_codon:yes stop_codon:yes gene_type:complete
MIKTIIRGIYSAFISIVLLSIILASWTVYALFSQPTKSSEITNVIQNIYESQKAVIIDVFDLSKLLIKDTTKGKVNEKNNILPKEESLTDRDDKSHLDESSNLGENADNPLGIVIEPSLPDVIEKKLSEISEEPIVDEQIENSINEIHIEMDMN